MSSSLPRLSSWSQVRVLQGHNKPKQRADIFCGTSYLSDHRREGAAVAITRVLPRAGVVTGDNPIESRTQDRLGRARFADELAGALRGMGAGRGIVVGLTAPWGSGKTSVLNMVAEQLEVEPKLTVVPFNPWMFSGSDQLIHLFFEQLAAELRLRGGKADSRLADRLIEYGQAVGPLQFVPVAGVWMSRAGALAASTGKLMKGQKKPESVATQREEIERALRDLPSPLVVVLDDIDRLTPPEIRDIFRLVRLTAHFPNVIYLLAFDRARVERALDSDADTGRAYLEKIIEVDFDLPAIPEASVIEVLLTDLAATIEGLPTGAFDEYRWQDVVVQIMRPLFRTVRDVNRYLATLPATLATIGVEVCLVDVLTLEAVRLRLPRVFAQLPDLRDLLTNVGMRPGNGSEEQAEIERLLSEAGPDRNAVAAVLRLLFPATERYLGGSHYGAEWLGTWQRERRVASPRVLDFFLSRLLPATAVDAATVDEVLAHLGDTLELRAILGRLKGRQIEDLLGQLEGDISDVGEAAVEPACSVLLELYPAVSRPSLGMGDFGPELAIDRVVVRLLHRIEAADERVRVTQALRAGLTSYTGQLHLLDIVGWSTPLEPALLAATDRDLLRQSICREIRHADVARLKGEPDILAVLGTALAEDPADRADVDVALQDPIVAASVLRSALSEIRSRSLSSVAEHAESVLMWEDLVTVLGGNEAVGSLLELARPASETDPRLALAVSLAKQYLEDGPPSQRVLARRPFVRTVPQNSPHSVFSPSGFGGVTPTLVLRAMTTYDVDPAWNQAADVSAREVIDTVARLLADQRLAEQLTAAARNAGFDPNSGEWAPDPTAVQTTRSAVARLDVSAPDGTPVAAIRFAVHLSDQLGPCRLLVDILTSEAASQDDRWFPMSLDAVARLLDAALSCLAKPVADQLLAKIFSGEIPPRSSTEVHVECLQTGDNQRAVTTLVGALDLSPLGPPSRIDQAPNQGMFAVAGDAPLESPDDRRALLRTAFERMARDWGYIDVESGLPSLLAP